jgi:2-polyprenyl-6-methoxyphenol hydroxylase-like FAD-dependent oxidoreductase
LSTDQSDEIVDVLQIGYGPVGQVNAGLLGRLGRTVAVVEQYPGLYGLPRAGHVDHEIMRIFQTLGCAEQATFDAVIPEGYRWQNQHGQTLVAMDWGARKGISGWYNDYLVFQPCVEDALDAATRRCESVTIHHGWQALDIVEHADHVAVTVRSTRTGQNGAPARTRTLRGRYLVAADGGNSFVRRHLGLEFIDLGFSQDWLVLDFRLKHRSSSQFANLQMCDPARPHGMFPIGQRHRRFSFMVGPDERETMLREETAWDLVSPYISADDAELIRQTVYLFEARLLDDWRVGRVFLIGDSAHIMPPFLGQGMCSGLRDAANLTWKLDLVLRGTTADALLDTYTLERRQHAKEYTELSMMMGRVVCMMDREAAGRRDAEFLNGKKLEVKEPPYLESGIIQTSASPRAAAVVGRLGPQGTISIDGRTALCDDVAGAGWQLLSMSDREAELTAQNRAFLANLNAKLVNFAAQDTAGAVDPEGFYAAYFLEAGLDAILVRPDFYVFGALEASDDVNDLVANLRTLIGFVGA